MVDRQLALSVCTPLLSGANDGYNLDFSKDDFDDDDDGQCTLPNPDETAIRLIEPPRESRELHEDIHGELVAEFKAIYEQERWQCPELKYMDFCRYNPNTVRVHKGWESYWY